MFLLVVALAGLVVFLSFHVESLGPKQTVTIGINISPWLTWSRIHGLGDLGQKVEVKFLTWSVAGLGAAVAALALRTRCK